MMQTESSLITIRKEGGNAYLFDHDNKYISLTHPRLMSIINGRTEEVATNDYYLRKYDYLTKHGIGRSHTYEDVPLGAGMIDYALIDLRQLIFEVTDSCNLRCKYCGYGELYSDYDERLNKIMNLEDVSGIIDYLLEIWKGDKNVSRKKPMYISFYGGEPLLNIEFVKEVVEYFKNLNIDSRKFLFSMTTNAMQLDRHMDFLAENDFHLLISLDGNRNNNGYRVKSDGNNSFDRVISNIDMLQKTYPEYFKKSVSFNAVLHNRNSVFEINEFIRERFDKKPRIAELNSTGISPDKRDEYNRLYRNFRESLYQVEDYEEYERNIYNSPSSNVAVFLHCYTPFVFRTHNDLLSNKSLTDVTRKYIPTGTCVPFSKKMFITVGGKIMACERIGQQFSLGMANKHKIDLNSEAIAKLYNELYSKVKKQCVSCLRKETCIQCVFNLDDIDSKQTVVCRGYLNKDGMRDHAGTMIDYLEKNPTEYNRIMTEIVIS